MDNTSIKSSSTRESPIHIQIHVVYDVPTFGSSIGMLMVSPGLIMVYNG